MLSLRPSEKQILAQRGYKILKGIGEGIYAQVFLTKFKGFTNSGIITLACKIISTHKAPKNFVMKFLPRELDILIRLNHPRIIHSHSIFHRKEKYYVFMRYAEKGDLLTFILNKGPVPEAQGRLWVRQISLAIQYLHEMDVAHRDLKCKNCLIKSIFNINI